MPHYTPTSPEVSVLMVTHDAERSVRRAVESFQNQTLRNIELVVVDAGSADGTLRQLDAVAERDMRVSVARADGCARQEALDLALSRARGAYLVVADADGWARPSMLADLTDAARESSLDLVAGGISLTVTAMGRPNELEVTSEPATYLTQHDFRADAWRHFASGLMLPAGAKLFSRDRVERLGLSFSVSGEKDDGPVADRPFVMGYLRDVERVGVLEGACYHLDRRLSSTEVFAGRRAYHELEREYDALLDLYRHWELDGDAASMDMLQSRYVERLVACVEGVCGMGTTVSSAEQRDLVAEMIGTDRARLASSVAQPRSNQARSMLSQIRACNVAIVCVQARLISLLRGGRVADVVPDVFA